jgi:hypothetical protein
MPTPAIADLEDGLSPAQHSAAEVPAESNVGRSPRVPCVAYYLGQYHRLPLNDRFWGTGFTEWHNVARARPLYPGHQQPKLPADLGFYDLRCDDTLREQAAYAHSIGVSAFCFWHYWFAGERLLHGPLESMLRLAPPNFKFMLGWANETWSGVWHGASSRILIEQTYNAEELDRHARLLAQYIATGLHLSLEGRYPFVIYRPRQIPNAPEYLARLRELVARYSGGAQLYIIGNWFQGSTHGFRSPASLGLDAAVITPIAPAFRTTAARKAYAGLWQQLRRLKLGPEVRPYSRVPHALETAMSMIDGTRHATVVSGWDNTPRSGRRGLVLSGYTERTFRHALEHALALELQNPNPLLFLKSWNEWAEGNTVEPIFHETWSAGAVLRDVLLTPSSAAAVTQPKTQTART